MARYQNNPFSNVTEQDYANYTSWPQVVLPDGQVMYQVPGNPGYVLDPVASAATGRKVFRQNPKGAIEEQQKAQQLQDEAIKQQQFNQSPLGQLLPVGAGLAGTIAAAQFAPASPVEAAIAAQLASQGAGATGAGALAGSAASGALPAAGSVAVPTGLTLAPAGTTATTAAAPGLFSGIAGMGALPLAGIAAGTALGAKGLYDLFKGKNDKSLAGKGGRVVLGMATGGLSELARPFAMHKSTREEAADKTKSLLKQSEDPAYQAYVQGMRKQYESAPTGKAYAGKYDTWSEYEKAGLEASDLTGVYGNIKTYGEEWAKLTEPQRQAITQANIDSGLYKSKKGDVEITDKNKALENKNNVLKGFQVGAQTTAPASPLAAAAAQGATAIPRPVVPQPTGFVRR